jgi:hypothetical protein
VLLPAGTTTVQGNNNLFCRVLRATTLQENLLTAHRVPIYDTVYNI